MTGEAQAVFLFEKNLNLEERVLGMHFDTINSNAGGNKDTCIPLEKLIHHKLLHISYCHYILDLIARTENLICSICSLLFKCLKQVGIILTRTTLFN